MSRITPLLLVVPLVMLASGLSAAARAAAIPVEPSELSKRNDLVGKEVSVDDRVALFLFHPGRDFDEITLKRTPVLFRLPPRLRYRQSPGAAAVRLTGILGREGEQWVCDVTAIELFPKDLVRLNRGIAVLPASEFEKRGAWAAWASRRGKEFQDAELAQRALEIDREAIRIEAESKSTDPAKLWMKLAERARAHGLPEPEPSALAHRSFRARLSSATDVEALTRLQTEIAAFFPDPKAPIAADPAELARWDAPYENNPAEAYRSAPEPMRRALDHRLWADTTQRLLERTAEREPTKSLKLGEEATQLLPDRPKVAEQLLEQGLKTETFKLQTLRLSEVKALAKLYETRLHRPAQGRDLLRRWLDEQRDHQMSPTDAEGRIGLAALYEELIDDRERAIELLHSAWKIDPQSKELADAFRQRGYRKVNNEWIESSRNKGGGGAEPSPDTAPDGPGSPQNRKLTNLTPSQVRTLLGGKPNRVIYSGSQGQLIEQWIYFGTKQDQYINFLRTPGSDAPRVVAYYSLPRRAKSRPR